jgi:hypothetical protein
MREDQIDQAERLATLENDRKVRSGTFFSQGLAQSLDTAGGRFGAAMGAPTVVGSAPVPRYPAAAAHQADPVPAEPPLGYSVDAMPIEPSTVPCDLTAVEQTGGAAAAPSSAPDVERAAPPSFPAIGGGPALEESFPASSSTATIGSSPTNPGRR